MRKFLIFLLMSLITTMAWGMTVVTFIPGEDSGIQPTVVSEDCMSKDGVTICTSYGALGAAQYRFGKNSITTVSSEIGDIIKIVFYCPDSNPATGFSEPEMTIEGNDGVWEGRAPEVQFFAGIKQVRATRIDVYVDDNVLHSPEIHPASGTYYNPIEVTITCSPSVAKVYYTLDGTDPTTASTRYTEPFTLSSDAVVKAIAERDGEISGVVSAEYVFGESQQVHCFEDLLDTPDETVVRFLGPLYTLAQNKNHLYVKDECAGCALIYGPTGQTYTLGDVIPTGVALSKTTYNGEPEWRAVGGFQSSTSNIHIDPETITADQVGHEMFAHYVRITDVTFSTTDNGNYYLTDALGNQCSVYFGSMGVSPNIDLSATYPEVIGIVGSYVRDSVIYQFLPICYSNFILHTGFGRFEEIEDDTEVFMEYDATVIAQAGRYLYAFDDTGYGLIYGQVDKTYEMGDVIPAGFTGTKTTFSCQPELNNPQGLQDPIGKVDVVPEEITMDCVTVDMRGHYVVLRGVKLDDGRIVPADGMGEGCPYYNRFNVWIPGNEDPDALYDVYGIVGVYCRNGGDLIIQILPLRIEPQKPIGPVCCIEDLFDKPKGLAVQFECPLIVIYQSVNHLYVKDKCDQYTLIYGNVGGTFVNGDSIIGCASWTTYNDIPQLTREGDWQLVAHGPKVLPEGPFPIEEVSADMIYHYVCFDDVTVTKDEEDDDDRYYTMSDGDETMKMYNQFGIQIPVKVYTGQPNDLNDDGIVDISDLNALINYILTGKYSYSPMFKANNGDYSWDNCYVEGILTMFRNELELLPIRVTTPGRPPVPVDPAKRFDINDDGSVNISDLNELISIILRN